MNKEKSTKVITILTLGCALIFFISGFFSYILPSYLSHRASEAISYVDSQEIIGGADGPTAIFITGQFPYHWLTAIFGLLTLLGIIYIVVNKSKRNYN